MCDECKASYTADKKDGFFGPVGVSYLSPVRSFHADRNPNSNFVKPIFQIISDLSHTPPYAPISFSKEIDMDYFMATGAVVSKDRSEQTIGTQFLELANYDVTW